MSQGRFARPCRNAVSIDGPARNVVAARAHGDPQCRRRRSGPDGPRHRARDGSRRPRHHPRQGHAWRSRRATRPAREAAPEGGRARQAERGRSRGAPRAPALDDAPPRPRRRRPRDRVDRRGVGGQAGLLRAPRRRRAGAGDLRDQHLDADRGRHRLGHQATRALHRAPLLQPRARHEAGRGGAEPQDVARDGRDLRRLRQAARQGAGGGRRLDGLHREPAPRPVHGGCDRVPRFDEIFARFRNSNHCDEQ